VSDATAYFCCRFTTDTAMVGATITETLYVLLVHLTVAFTVRHAVVFGITDRLIEDCGTL
jgi:hypothetical protein